MNNSNEDVAATTNSNVMCRMTKIDGELTRPEFEYYSGLQCYRYLGSVIDGFESRLKSEDGLLYYEVNSSSPLVKFDPSQVDLFEQTMSPFEFEKWRECSQQAMRCCDDVMALESIDTGLIHFYLNSLKYVQVCTFICAFVCFITNYIISYFA